MRFAAFHGLILLWLGSLTAAPTTDVTGKWTAQTFMSSSGSDTPVQTTFIFTMEGDTLTGTVSSSRGKYEILDGKVDGDSVVFTVQVTGDSRFKIMYDGKITAEGIDFITTFEGRDRSDHFIAKRVPG